MKDKMKKVFASLLAAMMIFTYMPTIAFANDGDPVVGWTEGYTAYYYEDGGEIVKAASVKSVETEPTCGVDGKITYTAYDASDNVIEGSVTEVKGKDATGDHKQPAELTKVPASNGKGRATCNEAGFYDEQYVCETCGQTITANKNVEEPALGHRPGEPETSVVQGDCTKGEKTVTTTTTKCSVCGEVIDVKKVESDSHVWTEEVTKEATCTEAGEKTKTCSKCGAVETEEIKALGHKKPYKTGKDHETAAKCGEAGSYEEFQYCERCGAEIEGTRHTVETAALEHDWAVDPATTDAEGWKLVSEAKTCGEKSVYERVCKRCGKKETKEVQAVDHTWSEEKQLMRDKNFIKATCLHDGQHAEAYVCTKCGAVKEDSYKVIKDGKGEHVWEVTKVSKAPTCTATGIGDRKCKVCGLVEQDAVLDKIPHTAGEPVKENIVNATCEEDGSFDLNVYCTACATAEGKYLISSEHVVVPAFGHEWVKDEKASVAPTCLADGKNVYVCKNDPTHKKTVTKDSSDEEVVFKGEQKTLKALGHDWKETSYTAPTCVKKGSRTVRCNRCNDIHAEELPMLEHDASKYTYQAQNVKDCTVEIDKDGNATAVPTSCKEGSYDLVTICPICGEIRREAKKVAGDESHIWKYKFTVEPNCDQQDNPTDGKTTERTCLVCGITQYADGEGGWTATKPATAKENTIASNDAHDWKLVDKNDPTCTVDGKAVYECTKCKDHMEKVLPAPGHVETGTKIAASIEWDASTNATKAIGYVTYSWKCSQGIDHKKTTIVKFDSSLEDTAYRVKVERTEPTCKDGKVVYTFEEKDLEVANATYTVTADKDPSLKAPVDAEGNFTAHVWGDPVKDEENAKAPTCTEDGYYDFVVTCEVCGAKKTAGDRVILPKLGHDFTNEKKINIKVEGSDKNVNFADDPCVTDWTYDTATFCDRCGAEKPGSRKTVVYMDPKNGIDGHAKGHTAGEAVKENEVEATCYEKGSYDEVVYCTACGEELSREKVVVDEAHTWKLELDPEKTVAPTCVDAGTNSYKIVCSTCGQVATAAQMEKMPSSTIQEIITKSGLNELDFMNAEVDGNHINISVKATGVHTPMTVRENETATTYDKVVYCSVCGYEISRETVAQESYEEAMEDAQDALDAAEDIDDTYPADSVAAVEAAKAELKALLDAGETDPAKIEAAVNKLNDAIEAAEIAKEAEQADEAKQHAQAEAVAEEALNEADKLDTAAFSGDDQQAIKDAKIALRTALKTDASTEELKAATKALEDAIAAAKENKAAVDKANADAAKITAKNKYTSASVKAVAAAKAALETAVKGGKNAEIKKAVEDLNKAVADAKLKAKNTLKASGKTLKAKAKKTKKFKKSKAFKISKAKGKVTFKKVSGNKKITVNAKTGKVTVKKGLKKGKTYKVKVKITAKGNGSYLKGSKTVTLKIKVN